MPLALPDASLDAVLALQFTVAWAGEGRCEPKRLGWWGTDLIDEAGGGDLLGRLLPRTKAWASLEAVREAARRVDAKARGKMADPDRMRSIFFLGFEVDEALSDRLAALKQAGRPPAECLPFKITLGTAFSREALADALRAGSENPAVVPGGRQLKGPAPAEPEKVVARLAAALAPFPEQYPLPFFLVGT